MTKINTENISRIKDSNELIDFIALNRYDPENSDLLENRYFELLPDYVQHIILIFDFETEYEMQGLFTLLENTTGTFLPLIAVSFEKTDNKEISNCIKEVLEILSEFNLTPEKIRKNAFDNTEEFDIKTDSAVENKNLENRLNEIDKKLSELIEINDYWENVIKTVDGIINAQQA